MLCWRKKIKTKIVCLPLVGGKKKNGKVDHVRGNLEKFQTYNTDFIVNLKKKNIVCQKEICHVGGKKEIAGQPLFFLGGHNSGLSEDPSYVEYNQPKNWPKKSSI